ncbi:MAG: peptidylprolyl isomerase [Paracoccaceae bacterium]|nr:peptidylprolyl isomerase [Paracoccaceae bacterium]
MFKQATVVGAIALSLAFTFPARAADPTADTVVAVVNGQEITLGHMISTRESLPAQYQELEDAVLFDGILEQLIQQTALAEEGEGNLTRRDLLALENQRRTYLAGAVLDRSADSAVTEEALNAVYDAKFAAAEPSKEFSAAHILVETEEEAKALKAELDGGADFAALAKDKSTGPSGPNGGDLGWFGLGMMVKPFEDAVLALEPGQVSDPIQTQFGWHVIKLNETRMAEIPSLDDSRAELEGDLRSKAVEARVVSLTDNATIEKMVEGIDKSVLRNTALLDN